MGEPTEREWLEGLRPEDEFDFFAEDETMVDLGGGMVVPLRGVVLHDVRLDEWVQEHRPEWCYRIDHLDAPTNGSSPARTEP